MTLLEVMVASTIASIVIAAATASTMAIYRTVKDVELRTSMDAEGKMLGEYLVRQIRPIGSTTNLFRPWALVYVDNNYNSTNRDRLVFAEIINDWGPGTNATSAADDTGRARECSIINAATPNTKISIEVETVAGTCCLSLGSDAWPTGGTIERLIMGSTTTGNTVYSLRLQSKNTGGTNCRANFRENSASTGNPLVDVPTLQWPKSSLEDLTDGAVGMVTVTEIWLETTTNQLKLKRYNAIDTTSSTFGMVDQGPPVSVVPSEWVIADDVYDLQFALGYDVPPSDGHINNFGTSTDEWVFNASGSPAADLTVPSGANHSDLRMVMVGVTLGAKSKTLAGNTVSMLNGPNVTVPGLFLRSVVTTSGMRNLYLFDL